MSALPTLLAPGAVLHVGDGGVLRSLTPEDRPALAAQLTACFPPDSDDPVWPGRFLEDFAGGEGLGLFDRSGVLCSTLFFLPGQLQGVPLRHLGYLYAISTRPDRRGQGCARTLLSASAKLAQAAGYDALWLQSVPQAKAFYEKLGYRPQLTVGHLQFSASPETDNSPDVRAAPAIPDSSPCRKSRFLPDWRPCDFATFFRLRCAYACYRGDLRWPRAALHYVYDCLEGNVFLTRCGMSSYYVCLRREGAMLTIPETNLPPQHLPEFIPSLLRRMGIQAPQSLRLLTRTASPVYAGHLLPLRSSCADASSWYCNLAAF